MVTVISPSSKPETSSLNVAVTGIDEVFVGSVAVVDKTSDGPVPSYVLLSVAAAVFPFPAPSIATADAPSIDTRPSEDGKSVV